MSFGAFCPILTDIAVSAIEFAEATVTKQASQ